MPASGCASIFYVPEINNTFLNKKYINLICCLKKTILASTTQVKLFISKKEKIKEKVKQKC